MADVEARIEARSERLRPSNPPRIAASYAKLRRETGWSPNRSLTDSLVSILDHWRQTLDA